MTTNKIISAMSLILCFFIGSVNTMKNTNPKFVGIGGDPLSFQLGFLSSSLENLKNQTIVLRNVLSNLKNKLEGKVLTPSKDDLNAQDILKQGWFSKESAEELLRLCTNPRYPLIDRAKKIELITAVIEQEKSWDEKKKNFKPAQSEIDNFLKKLEPLDPDILSSWPDMGAIYGSTGNLKYSLDSGPLKDANTKAVESFEAANKYLEEIRIKALTSKLGDEESWLIEKGCDEYLSIINIKYARGAIFSSKNTSEFLIDQSIFGKAYEEDNDQGLHNVYIDITKSMLNKPKPIFTKETDINEIYKQLADTNTALTLLGSKLNPPGIQLYGTSINNLATTLTQKINDDNVTFDDIYLKILPNFSRKSESLLSAYVLLQCGYSEAAFLAWVVNALLCYTGQLDVLQHISRFCTWLLIDGIEKNKFDAVALNAIMAALLNYNLDEVKNNLSGLPSEGKFDEPNMYRDAIDIKQDLFGVLWACQLRNALPQARQNHVKKALLKMLDAEQKLLEEEAQRKTTEDAAQRKKAKDEAERKAAADKKAAEEAEKQRLVGLAEATRKAAEKAEAERKAAAEVIRKAEEEAEKARQAAAAATATEQKRLQEEAQRLKEAAEHAAIQAAKEEAERQAAKEEAERQATLAAQAAKVAAEKAAQEEAKRMAAEAKEAEQAAAKAALELAEAKRKAIAQAETLRQNALDAYKNDRGVSTTTEKQSVKSRRKNLTFIQNYLKNALSKDIKQDLIAELSKQIPKSQPMNPMSWVAELKNYASDYKNLEHHDDVIRDSKTLALNMLKSNETLHANISHTSSGASESTLLEFAWFFGFLKIPEKDIMDASPNKQKLVSYFIVISNDPKTPYFNQDLITNIGTPGAGNALMAERCSQLIIKMIESDVYDKAKLEEIKTWCAAIDPTAEGLVYVKAIDDAVATKLK